MTHRRITALVLLSLAVVAAGAFAAIGSGSASAGAEERAKGASAVPADALAYASVNLDRDGAPFRSLEALAAKVDGGEAAVARLNDMLDGRSGQAEMIRALGGDVSVGLLGIDPTPVAAGGQPAAEAVVVATAADGPALAGALRKAGFDQGPAIAGRDVWEQGAMAVAIQGSTAIAGTSRASLADAIGAQTGAKPALADDPAFTATIAKLPGDAVAVAYIAPARLAGIIRAAGPLLPKGGAAKDAPDMAASLARLAQDLQGVRGLGIAVTAEAGGLRVIAAGDADQAALQRLGARFPTAYAPAILAQVPADAVGVAAFRDLGPTLLAGVTAMERRDPQARSLIASIEKTTGIGVAELAGALGGEHAVYATAGATPGAALITRPQDPAAAAAVLGRVVTAARDLAAMAPKQGEGARRPLPPVAVTRDGGTVAVGSLRSAAATPSASIADSAAFRAIADRAGLPGEVTGVAYIDGAALRAAARARGVSLPAGSGAIGGALAWGTATGGVLYIPIG